MIRKLFELNKISNKSRKHMADVYCYESSGKHITWLNQHMIDEVYCLDKEKKVKRSIPFLANQLIHSCTLFTYMEEGRNRGGIYACSDFERNQTIYRIPVSEIIKIFELVAHDYPTQIHAEWSDKTNDYVIATD